MSADESNPQWSVASTLMSLLKPNQKSPGKEANGRPKSSSGEGEAVEKGADDHEMEEADDDDWGELPVFTSSAVQDKVASPERKRKRGRPSKASSSMPAENEASESKLENKKKRKHSDAEDAGDRKKRRAHDEDEEARTPEPPSTQDISSQQSPSAARHKRRRKSREGKGHNPAAAQAAAPNLDNVPEAEGEGDDDLFVQQKAIANLALAVEQNGDQGDESGEDDEGTSDRRKSRTSRKKSKPSYYEQADDNNNYDEEYEDPDLPSPSAATPKGRRTKAASRKRAPNRKRLRDDAPGGADDWVTNDRARQPKTYRQGKFSEGELRGIAHAIERFRAENNLEQHEVNAMIQAPGGTTAGSSHAALWEMILAECPDRARQKVINISRKKFHNFVARGTWTEEQDYELGSLISVHGKSWSKIAAIINRHPEDIRDRYRNYLICGNNQRKEAWSEEEEARLTHHIIEVQGAIDLLDETARGGKTYEELIDWQSISELMGRTRSRLQCITKWKSMNLRTHPKDTVVSRQPDAPITFRLEKARRQINDMPEEDKYRFVLAIDGTQAGSEAKIPWHRLVDKQFRQHWGRPTLALLWHRLKISVPDWERLTVRDCCEYLKGHYNNSNELPDVTGEGFDDQEEMALIEAVPYTGSSVPKTGGAPVSDEIVHDDEDEDEDEGEGEKSGEMEIDPALDVVPEANMGPVAATPAKRTLNGKRPGGRKPKRPDETPSKGKGSTRKSAKSAYDVESDSSDDDDEDVPARI